jgi:single-stranded DNA-binding protein
MNNGAWLRGSVVRDAEVKATSKGGKMVTFCVNCYNGKEGEFYNCTYFGDMPDEAVSQIKARTKVFVEGIMSLNKGKDGKIYLNIIAKTVAIEGGSFVREEPKPRKDTPSKKQEVNNEDIPF